MAAILGRVNHHHCFQGKNQSQCGSNFWGRTSVAHEYQALNVISWGSYGVVYRAVDKQTGEIVAMKEVDGLSPSTSTEISILSSLPRHPSIVEFKQVIGASGGSVLVVMEYLESDLRRFMDGKRKPFAVSEIKFLMKQILEGVDFIHENGVMHRDLKPSNILMNENARLKICDFGLSHQRTSGWCTSRAGTLWYKAPEILVGARRFLSATDMWSVGCIMAELVLKEVLFPGISEPHQLECIERIVGTPYVLRLRLSVAASFSGAPLLSPCGFDLLERLLAYDPNKRISARDALNHSWFKE